MEFSPISMTLIGRPAPLGATFEGDGVNFALYSAHAERVELCLFDGTGRHEIARVTLPQRTGDVWHGFVPGLTAGQLYGYRVHGAYAPEAGHRFNPHKLLVDPYARELRGRLINNDANFGYIRGGADADLSFDTRDNAAYMPKCVVVGSEDQGRIGSRPYTPWRSTIIYELHVAGMTRLHPDVPVPLRGTFTGLASQAVTDHLKALGITAIELLPIFPFADEPHLVARGLTNYWGYNPYCFLAPEPRYAIGPARAELRAMVRHFHDAGIEVILDVVYNHTGEGWHLGPTLSLRGIDNSSYYRLSTDAPRYYVNDTGCGNTLALDREPGLGLALASLRHLTEEFGIDGFRFDLATTLARSDTGFDRAAPFLRAIQSDPVLSAVKLIAEPWDVGPGGYRLGSFPGPFAEWNDRYRNAVRGFWRGDEGRIGELATRLTGSADIFADHTLGPLASLNFVTAHDGFTLRDLVSYSDKHNEANGEQNRDGTDDNLSANYGTEGPTSDPGIAAVRARQAHNILATLLLSQGVPMLLAGDEIGHTQHGNNNAYCQDNELSWIDWSRRDDGESRTLLALVRRLIELRASLPALRQSDFLAGAVRDGEQIKDASWWSPEGREMAAEDWQLDYARAVGLHIAGIAATGDAQHETNRAARANLLILFNAHDGEVPFRLPPGEWGPSWQELIDTADAASASAPRMLDAGASYLLAARSLALLTSDVPARQASPINSGEVAADKPRPENAVENATIDRLCAQAGVETAYWDLKGRERVASIDTKRALLAAMGIATNSEHAARDEVRRLDLTPWRRLLEPASVLRRAPGQRPFSVPVTLAASLLGRPLSWTITLETGSARAGETVPRALVTTSSRRVDGEDIVRLMLPLPADLPLGTHQLTIAIADHQAGSTLHVTPAHAYRPDWIDGDRRQWGLACQLYGLRANPGRHDLGIGDLGSLGTLARDVGQAGGAALGVNPLHALFVAEPHRASPYSPSSRVFLNPLYLDVASVPEFADCPEAFALLSAMPSAAGAGDLVDYPAVARAKHAVLGELFRCFEARSPRGSAGQRRLAFETFEQQGGKALQNFVTFQALESVAGPASAWPSELASPDTPAVARFAQQHAMRCRYFAYLQFEMSQQLTTVADLARGNGMAIGLYGDLAVGAAPDGAEVWAEPDAFAKVCRFGAPPDPFSDTGQDWGMPPMSPHALTETGYRSFAAMLAANMRHAGALRLDHVMWLERMFWIPDGGTALDGAYVRYPRDDLLGVLALESHRHRCLVVGEDLGTVPDGFRERMEHESILSYRFVRFERFPGGLFRRPETYPAIALATPASHDLATLRGFWTGRDIEAMHGTGLISPDETNAQLQSRAEERQQLVAALADQQLLPGDFPLDIELDAAAMAELIDAVHRFLARTPCALTMLNIEDLAGVADQSNLPGTVDNYPNWRRRLPVAFDAPRLVHRLNETAALMRLEGRLPPA